MRGSRQDVPETLEGCNLSVVCPGCNETVTLNLAAGPVTTYDHSYFIGTCPNTARRHCRPVFAVYYPLNDVVSERYPVPSFEASWMHDAIPQSIREDFAEAKRCFYVKAYKGTVAMYRRVAEATACNKLGDDAKDSKGRTKRLIDLIDTMHSLGLITADVKASAHEVRHFGNYGAHIQDDGLDSVSRDEVEDVAEIAWQLVHSLFVAPAKTAELKKKRESKKGTSP